MRLRGLTRARRQRAQVEAMVAAYLSWQLESAAVRATYRHWKPACKSDAYLAFAAYRQALDREEQAANAYARLIPRFEPRQGHDALRQLAQLPVSSGPR